MTSDTGVQTTIQTDDGDLPAILWSPPTGSGPGLVLLQEIFGLTDYIRRRGAALAAAGYVVLAPELFGRLGRLEPVDESAPDALEKALGRVSSLDWDRTVRDALAALEHLRGRDEVGEVGIIGFCFGGGVAFNVAAVDDPACLVSYYGSAIPDLLALAPEVTAPSLHHFGLADDYIPADTVEQIRAAVTATNPDVVFETYDGANHAFDNDVFLLHHPDASARAWRRTTAFLTERLPTRDRG